MKHSAPNTDTRVADASGPDAPCADTPSADDALVFECDLPAPREKVWRALTEPALRSAWLDAPA